MQNNLERFVSQAICLALAFTLVTFADGCSRESRSEAARRTKKAGDALFGEKEDPAEKEHSVPLIAQEQQRRERIRQNTEWTQENQAKHPVEYCQAQLEQLKVFDQRLGTVRHRILVELNRVRRERATADKRRAALEKFLVDSKKAYRAAEKDGAWPVTLGGFALSQEKAQEKMVEAANTLAALRGATAAQANQEVSLQRKLERVEAEQRRIPALRERIQSTINDLRTKQVVDGNDGIADALSALNDALGALGTDLQSPSLDTLVTPSHSTNIREEFDALMRE
jgi:hypothetical protein